MKWRSWSREGLGQVSEWSEGKYGARVLASTRHDFVSNFKNRGKTDLHRH